MSLSENIRKFRTEKNMTQEQLANLLGVSSQAVSKWETSETYPDGSLLVLLANTLEVSLDRLFGNQNVCAADISISVMNVLAKESDENKFDLARTLCWYIEKGLFGWLDDTDDLFETADSVKNDSYILNDRGFTQISNGKAPFFSLFPEPECGWGEIIGDGEEMRKIFECLSSPETMKAILYIHSKEAYYIFEDVVLVRECNISNECLEKVVSDLLSLNLLVRKDINIDGKDTILYETRPSHKIIALLLFAQNMNYSGGYSYQIINRSETPFLR